MITIKNGERKIFERGRLLENVFSKAVTIQALTDHNDTHYSEFLTLKASKDFKLTAESQHDIFVLSGNIIESGKIYYEGSYLSRKGMSRILANQSDAIVFHYAEPLKSDGRNISLVPEDRVWRAGKVNGLKVCILRDFGHILSLVSWEPHTTIQAHTHNTGEEILVLEGKLCDQRGSITKGEWIRLYPDAEHAPYTEESTMILLRHGHLAAML